MKMLILFSVNVCIEFLHEEQLEECLKFGNKLSNAHICFYRHKMNVRIAVETLSSSVASGHPKYQGAHSFHQSN